MSGACWPWRKKAIVLPERPVLPAPGELASPLTGLLSSGPMRYPRAMNETNDTAGRTDAERERRLALARQAFKDFKAQCFWFWRDDPEIDEDTIPQIVRELRHNGGHRGYRIAAELCR